MLNIKNIACGLSVFCLLSSSLYAAYDYGNSNKTPTDGIIIFEQDDEKVIYSDYGFTRGDLSYLYDAHFDSAEVKNVSGEVTKVLRVQYPDNDCYLIALVETKANKGAVAVNLGPIWYVEEKGFAINEGDSIQVTGSKLRVNGRYVLIATEVSKDGKSLKIRGEDGTPLWGSPRSQRGNAECMRKPGPHRPTYLN